MEFEINANLDAEWRMTDAPIQVNDICYIIPLQQEFICGYIIPHEQFEYLYFNNWEYEHFVFAIQKKENGHNYARVLDKKSEKVSALHILRKAKPYES